jgi:hypothetical protein
LNVTYNSTVHHSQPQWNPCTCTVQYAYKEEICISKHNTHKSNTNLKENAALAVSKLMKEFDKHIGMQRSSPVLQIYLTDAHPDLPFYLNEYSDSPPLHSDVNLQLLT